MKATNYLFTALLPLFSMNVFAEAYPNLNNYLNKTFGYSSNRVDFNSQNNELISKYIEEPSGLVIGIAQSIEGRTMWEGNRKIIMPKAGVIFILKRIADKYETISQTALYEIPSSQLNNSLDDRIKIESIKKKGTSGYLITLSNTHGFYHDVINYKIINRSNKWSISGKDVHYYISRIVNKKFLLVEFQHTSTNYLSNKEITTYYNYIEKTNNIKAVKTTTNKISETAKEISLFRPFTNGLYNEKPDPTYLSLLIEEIKHDSLTKN